MSRAFKSHVVLLGMMGAGKSSVGPLVAAMLGRRFIDLDDEVAADAGCTIPELFEREGEPAFRRRELRMLGLVLAQKDPLVVALGGGTPMTAGVGAILAGHYVVWLDSPGDELWDRVKETARPLARSREAFDALYAMRRPVYQALADWRLVTQGQSPEDVARKILQWVRTQEGKG